MKQLILITLAGLVLAAAANAEDGPRAKAEEEFFKAYYQEHGRRDPAAAKKAYTQFIWDHEEDVYAADLCIRAHLGLARVAARSKSGDAKARLEEAKEWFQRIRGKVRSPVRVALGDEIATVTVFLATAREEDEVTGQIAGYLPELTLPSDDSAAKAAEDALVAFGTRAIPQLVTALRGANPRLVAGATRVLLRIPGDEPTMVLARALDDMDVLFPVQIAEQLNRTETRKLDIFENALTHPLPEVREAGVKAAGQWLEENGSRESPLWDLVTDLSEDSQARVQVAALAAVNWQAGTIRRLKAARAADGRPDLQRSILTSSGLDASSLELEHRELICDLLDSDDRVVRTAVFRLALERGEELAHAAFSEFLNSHRRTDNLQAAASLTRSERQPLSIYRDLIDAAFRAYMEEPEPTWERSFHSLVMPIRMVSIAIPDDEGVKLVTPLVSLVANSTSTPRRDAALLITVGLLERFSGGRDTAELLIPSYLSLDKDSDRASWLWTFGERLGDKGRGIATAAVASEHVGLRFQAVRILARHVSDPAVALTLRPFLDDPDASVREVAFSALSGVFEGEELADIAIAALKDSDARVRSAAVVPMLASGLSEGLFYLLSAVGKDPDLAPLAVKAAASSASPEEARKFVRDVLEELRDSEADAALRAAAWAEAGPVLSDEMILEALKSGEPQLIRVAALLAGKRRLFEAWPLLLSLDWDLPEAKSALERIREFHRGMKEFHDVRGADAEEALEKAARLASSEDPVKRRAAALALAGLGSPAAISLLLDLVEDENEAVRDAAMKALERLGG